MNNDQKIMKIVNNFDLFRDKLISQLNENEFCFIQVLVRRKDGHNESGVSGNNHNRLIKFYTIKNINEYDRFIDEIKLLCHVFNARAYIHPTKRNFIEVANELFRIFAKIYTDQNYSNLKRCYSTACGRSFVKKDKKYIIDLDDEYASDDKIKEITEFINNKCAPLNIKKTLYMVPTVHGIHLICKPFNTATFLNEYKNIDIHKNNPSLLYYEVI